MVQAVIFDMDGVLVDSEHLWDAARERYVREQGGRWHDRAQRDMMGMSSTEWSRYLRDELGVAEAPEVINAAVVDEMLALYEDELPVIPGAPEAVRRLAQAWPVGLASSSNRPLIDHVLDAMALTAEVTVSVSSEEVARGKPAPDVYLEAARRLNVAPDRCVAVEDSHNGILAAANAGATVIAVPNPRFAPGADALAAAHATIGSLEELTVELCRRVAEER